MQVEDNGEPRALQKFWIQIPITDENDPPGNFQLESNLVEENSPIGQLVGSFLVQDQDFYQTHTFVLLQETPLSSEGNAFFIDDNQLHLARVLNYEQDEFILITVQTIDNGTIPKNVREIQRKQRKEFLYFRSQEIFSLKFSILMNYRIRMYFSRMLIQQYRMML